MKNTLRDIVFGIINWQAKQVLKKFNPKVIAVVGSVGKTTTKDAIYQLLKDHVSVRANKKSLNSVIGSPLTILNLETGWNNIFVWLLNIIKGFKVLWFENNYPDVLVLELGIGAPGEMEQLAKLTEPDIIVFTVFPKVPVHTEFFKNAEHVIAEKRKVLQYAQKDAVIVFNADDVLSGDLIELNYETHTYGFNEASDVRVEDLENTRVGTSFMLQPGNMLVQLQGMIGRQHMYPVLAAAAVKEVLRFEGDINKELKGYKPSPGRMRILEGMNNSVLIDDTYNSSPIAMKAALESSVQIKASKHIAVLGHMAELGSYSRDEHQKVGKLCFELGIDTLIVVGDIARAIADSAQGEGLKNVHFFESSEDKKIMDILNGEVIEDSVVLVKGSQGARMEKISKQLLERPETAGHLLVRQEQAWEHR